MHDEANNFIFISISRYMNDLTMTAYLLSEWFSMGLIGVLRGVSYMFGLFWTFVFKERGITEVTYTNGASISHSTIFYCISIIHVRNSGF